jgi:hypothetical protein
MTPRYYDIDLHRDSGFFGIQRSRAHRELGIWEEHSVKAFMHFLQDSERIDAYDENAEMAVTLHPEYSLSGEHIRDNAICTPAKSLMQGILLCGENHLFDEYLESLEPPADEIVTKTKAI